MLYRGQFRDINNKLYTVDFITNNLTTKTIELQLSGKKPLEIETEDGDTLFEPVKSRSATVTIVTDEIISELYTGYNQGIPATIYKGEMNDNPEIIFEGYLTPCAYKQKYAKMYEDLELEIVDRLSTLGNIDYTPVNGSYPDIVPLSDILLHLFNSAGYTGDIYIQYYSLMNESIDAWSNCYLNENNFFDDDDEHTPWKMKEVLEEICKFGSVSAVPHNNNLYIVDYSIINMTNTTYKCYFNKLTASAYTKTVVSDYQKSITKNSYAGKGQSIDYDDVYNEITVECSIYETDKLTTDLFEDNANYLKKIGWNVWPEDSIRNNKDLIESLFYYVYQCQPGGCWKQYYYNSNNNYSLTDSLVGCSDSIAGSIQTYMGHTICALPQKVWSYVYGNSKSSYTSSKYICINEYCWDQIPLPSWTLTSNGLHFIKESAIDENHRKIANCKVLEYTYPEVNQWMAGASATQSATSTIAAGGDGIGFICINMELWYNCYHKGNGHIQAAYNDKTNYYAMLPFCEGVYNAGDKVIFKRDSSDSYYNKGWDTLQCQCQIGENYWNGSDWQTTPTTFWIRFHKDFASDKEKEQWCYNSWMKPVYNTLITDPNTTDVYSMVGEDCYAIKLNKSLCGEFKFSIYAPIQYSFGANFSGTSYLGSKTYYDVISDSKIEEYKKKFKKETCPTCFIKDLEIKYVFTPAEGSNWRDRSEFDDGDDIVYKNIIDDNFVQEFDEIELKINSFAQNKPISKSYIMDKDKKYTKLFYNAVYGHGGSWIRPETLVINKYYDHFKSPKLRYNCDVRDYYKPYQSVIVSTLDNKRFMVDSQSWDVKKNINTVNLVEF